jgi:hypothetical protein
MTEFEEILSKGEFVGIVEDNNDPDKKQRVRIRIPYLHGSVENIPTDALPWSQPFRDNDGLIFSIPEINKVINVRFPTGNLYYSMYINAQHLNINLQKKIEEMDGNDYSSFIALCYNFNTQIFISAKEGLNIIHNKSGLIIKSDGDITTRLNGNNSSYKIGDDEANQALLLSNNFFDWFDTLMNELTAPYIGNSGVDVVIKPGLANVLAKYKGLKAKFMSKNAFVCDNGTISQNDIKTQISIGDTFTSLVKNKTVDVKILELKKQIVKELKSNAETKKAIIEEKKDESINENDGLINDEAEIIKAVSASSNIITKDIIVEAETTSEPLYDESEENFSDDIFGDDNFSNNNFSNEDFLNNFNDDDNNGFSEFNTYNPENDTFENGSNILGDNSGSGIVTNIATNGIISNKATISNNVETLDMGILPAPGMISKFLEFDKVLYSSTAKSMKNNNYPDNNDHLRNLKRVTHLYWDDPFKFFRDNTEYTLVLNSAYRNLAVNTAVGGSKTSQHKSGSALDLILTDKKGRRYNNLLFYYLKTKMKMFGQLIWEGNQNDGPQWVHISLNNIGRTGSVFTAEGGRIKLPNEETLKILKDNGIM